MANKILELNANTYKSGIKHNLNKENQLDTFTTDVYFQSIEQVTLYDDDITQFNVNNTLMTLPLTAGVGYADKEEYGYQIHTQTRDAFWAGGPGDGYEASRGAAYCVFGTKTISVPTNQPVTDISVEILLSGNTHERSNGTYDEYPGNQSGSKYIATFVDSGGTSTSAWTGDSKYVLYSDGSVRICPYIKELNPAKSESSSNANLSPSSYIITQWTGGYGGAFQWWNGALKKYRLMGYSKDGPSGATNGSSPMYQRMWPAGFYDGSDDCTHDQQIGNFRKGKTKFLTEVVKISDYQYNVNLEVPVKYVSYACTRYRHAGGVPPVVIEGWIDLDHKAFYDVVTNVHMTVKGYKLDSRGESTSYSIHENGLGYIVDNNAINNSILKISGCRFMKNDTNYVIGSATKIAQPSPSSIENNVEYYYDYSSIAIVLNTNRDYYFREQDVGFKIRKRSKVNNSILSTVQANRLTFEGDTNNMHWSSYNGSSWAVIETVSITSYENEPYYITIEFNTGAAPGGLRKEQMQQMISGFITGGSSSSTQWIPKLADELLRKYVDGKYVVDVEVPGSWALINDVKTNTEMKVRLPNGQLINKVTGYQTRLAVYYEGTFYAYVEGREYLFNFPESINDFEITGNFSINLYNFNGTEYALTETLASVTRLQNIKNSSKVTIYYRDAEGNKTRDIAWSAFRSGNYVRLGLVCSANTRVSSGAATAIQKANPDGAYLKLEAYNIETVDCIFRVKNITKSYSDAGLFYNLQLMENASEVALVTKVVEVISTISTNREYWFKDVCSMSLSIGRIDMRDNNIIIRKRLKTTGAVDNTWQCGRVVVNKSLANLRWYQWVAKTTYRTLSDVTFAEMESGNYYYTMELTSSYSGTFNLDEIKNNLGGYIQK